MTSDIIKWLYVGICALFLVTPSIHHVMTSDEKISSFEKRELKQLPGKKISDVPISNYLEQWEQYFLDQYGLREHLIKLSNFIYYCLSRSNSEQVVIGKNGWLFYNGNQALKFVRGSWKFTDVQVLNIVRWFEKLQAEFEKNNTKMVVMIVPAKATVYSENLPMWARVRTGEVTNLDNVQHGLMKAGINVIDLKNIFSSFREENNELVYFKGDSHWNYLGARIAFQQSLHVFGLYYDAKNYGLVNIDNYGDLRGMLGLPKRYQSSGFYFSLDLSRVSVQIIDDNERSWARTSIVKNPNGKRATVMLIRDSFGSHLRPFYEYYFDTTITTHHLYGGFPWYLVEEYKPDYVIYEVTERYLTSNMQKPSRSSRNMVQ